ncbi:MAG: DUF5407 family protein [Waddliaceae bacterium]
MPANNLPNAELVDEARYRGDNVQEGFCVEEMFELVNSATVEARKKLLGIQESGDAVRIGDMFEMQMLMNSLAQKSEMASSVMSASHQAIFSMARNMK